MCYNSIEITNIYIVKRFTYRYEINKHTINKYIQKLLEEETTQKGISREVPKEIVSY